MQKIGHYLLASSVRANLFALLCILLPWPLSALSAIIVALITLQQGILKGLLLLSFVVLPAAAATLKSPEMAIPYDIGFLTCFFCWGFSSLLRQARSWSRILECITALGVVFVCGTLLLPKDVLLSLINGLETVILQNLQQAIPSDMASVAAIVHRVAPYLLGSLYTFFALLSMICLMLARVWQLKLTGMYIGNRIEFYSMRVSRWVAFLSAAVVLAVFNWQQPWLLMLSQIAILPFVFAGFSVLIYLNQLNPAHKYSRLILVLAASMVLLFMPRYFLVALALIGFADSWINVRRLNFLRIKRVSS